MEHAGQENGLSGLLATQGDDVERRQIRSYLDRRHRLALAGRLRISGRRGTTPSRKTQREHGRAGDEKQYTNEAGNFTHVSADQESG
ncbi:hypothetical protein Vau01_108140 [Virgisporangium aurantiacum]|uniref:Uncharacterized protein n=1 Tax=Virgisporangium aurantiacum TaxID=175570 RepID=A0A8J4E6M0_9ACTN|nr:hypothetical protein Vau01_108140 [Virgisporangium aurantiacum]